MKIFVNGKAFMVSGDPLSYEDLCFLAEKPTDASMTYVCPRVGDSERSGILYRGRSVQPDEGMRVECMVTGNA